MLLRWYSMTCPCARYTLKSMRAPGSSARQYVLLVPGCVHSAHPRVDGSGVRWCTGESTDAQDGRSGGASALADHVLESSERRGSASGA